MVFDLTEKIRFAVVGCGRMGTRRIRTIKENKNAELVCICDSIKDIGQALSNQLECEYLADYRKVVTRRDVDCIVVSLPNKFHCETTVSALANHKHVLCEKPLARTPQEATRMVEAATKSSAYLKVGSNLRYFLNVQKARELVDRGAIGNLLFTRGWIGHSGGKQTGTWFLDPDLAGGGTFLDNGSHILDLTRWFLGEVSECIGVVATAYWPIAPLEDIGLGIFRTLEGKLAFVQSSWFEWADYMYMELYGSEGYLRIDNRNPLCQLTLGDREGAKEVFDYSLLASQSYGLELEDFIQAIREGKQPVPSGYDGMRVVQMAFGVYESSKSSRSVGLFEQEGESSSGAMRGLR